MTETTVGREVVQIVEIQQPLCENTFGSAPCTASGTGDQKCYNTRGTCKDTANYATGTPLSLFFSRGNIADRGIDGAAYIIPSLTSVSTSPTRINLTGSNPNAQGLGNRALCSLTFLDHPHTDAAVDPYLSGRSWNPMDANRGSFWTRWIARNKYRQNIVIKVYEGYAGQALSAMTSRTYFLQSVSGPDASGRVTITGKDILAKLEERKAQAPNASPGELYAPISAAATSFEVAGVVEADYPASGTVRIDDEVITYSARALSANGVTFTVTARGSDGTEAVEHDATEAVQECLRYTAQGVGEVLTDLLARAGIGTEYQDTAGNAAEIGAYLSFYRLSALITEPVSIASLLSEVQIQALVYIWWDERTAQIKVKTIRGVDAEPETITAENNIVRGSFTISEKPKERASQVWVYFDQDDYTKRATDGAAYKQRFVIADLESETDDLYGEPSIQKVFGRWLNNSALAQTTASKIITRYVDIPSEVQFQMDAKDRQYWVGDTIKISHYLDVDAFGERRVRQWTIISAEEVQPGEIVQYVAEDTTLYGRIHYVMADAAPDYPGPDSTPFKNCYIGDANGLLSDGTPCGRIS